MPLSARRINELGERLKRGPLEDGDRRLFEEFRGSFAPAYDEVISKIRDAVGLSPTGRPDKRLESIVAKLRRGETSLWQMQDIAGCRITVPDRLTQDKAVRRLKQLFPDHREVDRRAEPRYGYRAVHLVVRAQGRRVEIQIRTFLQDLWANLEETWADEGADLKHGVEPPGYEGVLIKFMTRAGDIIDYLERTSAWLQAAPPAQQLGVFRGIMTVPLLFDRGMVSTIRGPGARKG